jgi:hypothetical protein
VARWRLDGGGGSVEMTRESRSLQEVGAKARL